MNLKHLECLGDLVSLVDLEDPGYLNLEYPEGLEYLVKQLMILQKYTLICIDMLHSPY